MVGGYRLVALHLNDTMSSLNSIFSLKGAYHFLKEGTGGCIVMLWYLAVVSKESIDYGDVWEQYL